MRPGRFSGTPSARRTGCRRRLTSPIGGIEQYIRVRGRSRANPVLLVLHGGPGAPRGHRLPVAGALEAAFTVVHWDQRGSGNTYYRDPAALPPTVSGRFRPGRAGGRPAGPVWPGQAVPAGPLLGKSAGRALCARRPEKLSAWLPVSQMVDFKRSEQVSAAEAIEGPARRAGGGGGTAGAGAGAGAGPAAAGPGGAEPCLRFRRRKERYLPPQYGGPSPLGDWPPRS